MHAMSNRDDDRGEPTTQGTRTTAPDGLGPASCGVLIRHPDQDVVAWGGGVTVKRFGERTLLRVPKLNLGHFITMRLLGRMPYAAAMDGCVAEVPADGLLDTFYVLGAMFPFYKTGEPLLEGVVLVLAGKEPLSIQEALELLKKA